MKIPLYKRLEIFLKWIVPILVLGALYIQIKSDYEDVSSVFKKISIELNNLYLFPILILGMIINWFLEAFKWKVLIAKIQTITIQRAMQAILNGLAFGLFTPFRVGDVITRIGHLEGENRSYALGCVYVARSSQLMSTLICGTAAAYFYFIDDVEYSLVIVTLLLTMYLILYYRIHLLLPYLKKINIINNYMIYIDTLGQYNFVELTYVLFISILRYFVIIFQYVLMFYVFNIDITLGHIITGVSITLLIKSILPIVSVLGDFGVRELVAVYVFNKYGIDSVSILSVTISIWLLNVVTPSVIGAFLSKNLRVVK